MKMTLLEMVQSILNDMDSDPVNDVSGTTESDQVLSIIKDTYFKLITSRDDWPFLGTRTQLTGLGDTSNPTTMKIPDGINSVMWIKYNKKDVGYMKPKDFQDLLDQRVEQTGVVDANGLILNNDPTYWTSFDDTNVVMDGYDSSTDSTLQGSKSVVMGQIIPTWTPSNDFIPTLPDKMFPVFLADAKGTAFLTLKQQGNAKEESFAQKGKDRMAVIARRVTASEPRTNDDVNFGRKGGGVRTRGFVK